MSYGIDTNTVTTPFLPTLQATPLPATVAPGGGTVSFICRYLGRVKWDEIDAIATAGFQIVSVLEHDSNHSEYFTNAHGLRDGAEAARLAAAIKQPTATPVYFAVDYDDAAWYRGNFSGVDDYFNGVATAMATAGNPYQIGAYAPAGVLEHLQSTGLATYFWQCGGSGMFHNRAPWASANIRQQTPTAIYPGTTAVTSHGLGVDYDIADNDAPGSWGPDGSSTPNQSIDPSSQVSQPDE